MKKVAWVLVFTVVFGLAALASAPSTMKGWISDEMCGAKGANASHKDCAEKCAKMGQKLVFVDDKSGKVMKIANQDAVKGHAGEHVEITASAAKDGSLNVDKIAAAADSDSKAKSSETHQH